MVRCKKSSNLPMEIFENLKMGKIQHSAVIISHTTKKKETQYT